MVLHLPFPFLLGLFVGGGPSRNGQLQDPQTDCCRPSVVDVRCGQVVVLTFQPRGVQHSVNQRVRFRAGFDGPHPGIGVVDEGRQVILAYPQVDLPGFSAMFHHVGLLDGFQLARHPIAGTQGCQSENVSGIERPGRAARAKNRVGATTAALTTATWVYLTNRAKISLMLNLLLPVNCAVKYYWNNSANI